MAHTEEEFREILNAESFVEMDVLASAAKNGVPMVRSPPPPSPSPPAPHPHRHH